MKETRSHAHSSDGEEKGVTTRKQKSEKTLGTEQAAKKPKPDKENHNGRDSNGNDKNRSQSDVVAEFEKFCKATSEYLSIKQMRDILEANGQDSRVSDDAVVPKCQHMMYSGPPDKCPICGGQLEFNGNVYQCTGFYSDWSSCLYCSRDPPRRAGAIVLPDLISESPVADLIKSCQDSSKQTRKVLSPMLIKPFEGMTISLSGRLSRTHRYWRREIEKNGGKVANSVLGTTCLVVSPAERERGGSSKIAEAVERGIPVVKEAWLIDCTEKQEKQPLEAYDLLGDKLVGGEGIPLDKLDPGEESVETMSAELKVYGKRGVHKDTKLLERGGEVLEKDGIVYNCAFSICDKGHKMNNYSILQLVTVPESPLHLYYKKGRIGDSLGAEERLEEWENEEGAIKEFVRLFEELTGNKFEPWEQEKKFRKQWLMFLPIDMDDRVDVRHGGLGLRQLGVAATHCKLDPKVANLLKVLCSQEIYKYAMMELGLDFPELPLGILSEYHLKQCEETLLQFVGQQEILGKDTGEKVEAGWADFSQKWFNYLPSARPLIFKDHQDLAEHAASAFESVRDTVVASHLIGDMTGSTIDDPLSACYEKLRCSVAPLDKNSDDYKMIHKYLEKTYEPVKVGDIDYAVSMGDVFAIKPAASPSYDDVKNLPNKILLWCGTRSSNLMRHLHKGFLPAVCALPVPGYMFGKAIICSDAAAEAARYGFTAVDRPEGFLLLAVVSLGGKVTEFEEPPEDTRSLEEKKVGVKGLGRKEPKASEHMTWRDGVKVPCGSLVATKHKQSPLEYNEYAVYDTKQVSMQFLVSVTYEKQGVVMDAME